MRAWFWTILLVTLAVAVAVLIHSYPGNVLIVVDQWRVQVSLALAALMTMAAFAGVYFLIRLFVWLNRMPERYRGWRTGRREKHEQSLLEQGWAALLEGRYTHAEKVLSRLSGDSRDPRRRVLAQLSAARAAHELGDRKRRDELIEDARVGASELLGDTSMSTAVAVAGADLWLEDGQARRALDALMASSADVQKHVHMMRLLLRAYQALGMHDKVLETARLLRRKDAIASAQGKDYVEHSAAEQLRQLQGQPQWKEFWKSLRSEEKLYPEVALAGAAGLQAQGESREASRLLEQAIKESFDGRLLAAYAGADSDQVNARLQKAEGWLAQRPDDVELLTALGALCLAAQMWGQAQRYLEQASKLRSDARVHALLGSLFDRIGRPQSAAKHWRLATAVSASLPVLAQDVHLPAADIAADPLIHHIEGSVEQSDDAVAHELARPTGDSIATAQSLYSSFSVKREGATGSTETLRQSAEDYHELFDSAPIPFDGSPALVIARSTDEPATSDSEHSADKKSSSGT